MGFDLHCLWAEWNSRQRVDYASRVQDISQVMPCVNADLTRAPPTDAKLRNPILLLVKNAQKLARLAAGRRDMSPRLVQRAKYETIAVK